MIDTVVVTGGNGKLGKATLEHLDGAGYRTVNLARGKQREDVADAYRTTDLTEAGEVYGSIARSDADAIVHLGTIPHPANHPGYVTYRNNVDSTYHVLEAATELGLERVCIASSINAIGAYWQDAPIEVDYLPVDEGHPARPRDPYGLAKHAMEVTADGIGRLDDGPGIVSLRFPWIATDDELRDAFVEPDRTRERVDPGSGGGRDDLFSYIHIADAARAVRRSIEAKTTGHEVCWTTATDTTMDSSTADLLAAYDHSSPGIRGTFDGHQALVDCSKADRLLDWTPDRSWRDLS